MPNIFDKENKEENLVKDRDVKPVKGYQPLGEPAPRKEENKTPQASEPQAQNEGLLPSIPNVPTQEMPLLFREGFNPAPVVPPTNYGQLSGSTLAGSRTNELVQAETIQRVQPQETAPLEQFLQNSVYREPPTKIDSSTQQRSNASVDFQAARDSWRKYIIPPKVGLSQGTLFNPDGTLDRTVPPEEITRAVNGLQSELGRSLEQKLDKENFWSRNIRRVGGFFQYGKNALDMLNQTIIDKIPFSPQSMGQKLGEILLGGDEELIEKYEENKKEIEREFIGKTLPDYQNSERSLGYELQPVDSPNIGEYGRAGALSFGAFLLNLGENLVSASAYEFADEYKRQLEQNSKIKSPILRTAMNGLSVLSAAGKSQIELVYGTQMEALDELIRGSTPEGDNRYVQVLKGKNISLANRWSERDYLGVQEPEGLEIGTRTGNLWWDLPENIHDNLLKLGIKTNLRGLHWATQGVVATILEFGLDSPLDSGFDSLKHIGKVADAADLFSDTGRVVGNLTENTKLLPDIPSTPLIRQPNTTSVIPNKVITDPSRLLDDPTSARRTLTVTSPDLIDVTKIEVSELPPAEKLVNPNFVEVTLKPEDFTPNVNRSQSLVVQLSDPTNAKPLYSDIPVVERNLNELDILAKSALDEKGYPLLEGNNPVTEAQLSVLMSKYPDEFTKYGKPVNLALPHATSIEVTDYIEPPVREVTKDLDTLEPRVFEFDAGDNRKIRGQNLIVPKEAAAYNDKGYRVPLAYTGLSEARDTLDSVISKSITPELKQYLDTVDLYGSTLPTEFNELVSKGLSDYLGFEVQLLDGYSYGEFTSRAINIIRMKDSLKSIMEANGATRFIEAHGIQQFGDVWRLDADSTPWQSIVDDMLPSGEKAIVVSCSGKACGLANLGVIDSWELVESGKLTKKTPKSFSLFREDVPKDLGTKLAPSYNVPIDGSIDSLRNLTDQFQSKLASGKWDDSLFTKMRLAEATIPASDYYTKVAKFPVELKGTSRRAIELGSEYVESLRRLKYQGLTLDDLRRNSEDLEGLQRGIRSRMNTIGHIGRQDINIELGTKQALGGEDYLETPKFRQPDEFGIDDANNDAFSDILGNRPNLPVSRSIKSELWQHGTSHKTDIRGYIPESGSGTHELGIGVYFTQNEEVAKAHALAFSHDNVPDSILDDLGQPNIKIVDSKRLRNVLDLNASPSKKQFHNLYKEGFMSTGEDAASFTDFWHFHKEHGGRFADAHDNFRLWYFDKYNTSAPESMVRDFQLGVYNSLKSEGVDAGLIRGANGEKMLVVYNPEKLINVDNIPVKQFEHDLAGNALEARRFADTYTYGILPDDYTDYSRLRSTDELADYLKQSYSEAYAKEYLKQSDEVDRLGKLRSDLTEEVANERTKVIDSFDPITEAEETLEKTATTATDKVGDILNRNQRFRKYRNEYEVEIRRIEEKLLNKKIGKKARQRLEAERDSLILRSVEVEDRVEALANVLRALHPDNPSAGSKTLEGLKEILKSHRQQTLNPKWYTRSGAYARRSAFDRFRTRIQRAASEYIDPMLGGDIGKIQEELVKLRRRAKGEFAYHISLMEADKKIAQVRDIVVSKLSKYDLTQEQIYEIINNLAELQASPYLLDKTLRANTNTGKYLASQLRDKFLRFHKQYGIPISELVEVAEITKQIPDVYHEVHNIIDKVGLSIGDEVTLGYIPRIKTRSAEFSISSKEGFKEGVADVASFRKSRKAFEYVVEDSIILDDYLKRVTPSFFDDVSKLAGREVTSVEDIIGDDNLLEYAFIGKLSDADIDALNELGILRKIPFTSDKVADYLISQYELPFKGLSDIFVQDPRRSFQMYKKGLEEYLGKSGMIYSVGSDNAWTVTKEFISTLSPEDASIYKGWVDMDDIVSTDMKSVLNKEAWESIKDVKVHPLVADLVNAQIKIQSSPFQLGVVGNMINSLTRYLQGTMLLTVQFGVNNVLGNGGALLARGINPAGAYLRYFTLGMTKGGLNNLPNSIKGFCGGKYTVKELYQQAMRHGLVGADTMFGAMRPLVYKGQAKDALMRSFVEFTHFAKNGGSGNSNWASGLIERFLDGAASSQDHTMFKYIHAVNLLTDDAYKMSLLDAVTADHFTPAAKLGRYFGELPHFDDIEEAVKWVERNAYMFDDVSNNENLGRLLIPFWTWQRKSFFNTVRFISDHPSRFGSYLKIVNSIRNDFEEDENAAWDALQMNDWMSKDSMIPLKIDGSISASGEDEYYVFPLGQIMPLSELTEVLETFNPVKPSKPVHANKANRFSVDRNGLKGWIITNGSPMVKGVLSIIDPDYLYDYDPQGSDADSLRDEYPFGMNKHSYQLMKMFGKPLYNVWKMLPESIVGRAPALNYRTGEWDEGVPSMFTGEVPHWTKYNQKTPLGREGMRGLVTQFLDLAGKNPYHIDVLITQDRTVSEINSKLYQIKDEVGRLRSRLSNTHGENKDQYQRIYEAYEEMKLTYIYLKAEKDIYDEWRRLNNLPSSDAVRKIKKQNIKVDMMLTKEERDAIYQRNFEMWYTKL